MGTHGTNFMISLEQRLDSVVYRLVWQQHANKRQLVNHGHILVDGKRVDIPSYSVQPGQLYQFIKAKEHRYSSCYRSAVPAHNSYHRHRKA